MTLADYMGRLDDENGWIINAGHHPNFNGYTKVDTEWSGGEICYGDYAWEFEWEDKSLLHWRLHNAACGNPPKSLDNAYDHLNTGNWMNTEDPSRSPVMMSGKEYIKSLEPLIEEQPIGLPLSRVCKAFTAITGHPMSEDHAETFLKVVEMCKGFAQTDD